MMQKNTLYVNVRILGYQDTLCANAGTQYYYKCYIAGNVDFIYGNEPRAFFNDCKLYSVIAQLKIPAMYVLQRQELMRHTD